MLRRIIVGLTVGASALVVAVVAITVSSMAAPRSAKADWACQVFPGPFPSGGHTVCGPILDKYNSMGNLDSPAGAPVNDTSSTPDGLGFYNHFANGWSIYWTPTTGAHEVHGEIRNHWSALHWEAGVLGYPVSDEMNDCAARANFFAKLDGGGNVIYEGEMLWTPATGAHEVHGAIYDHYNDLLGGCSLLGYPVTDELGTPDGIGRFNHFNASGLSTVANGSIYFTPATGAHAIRDVIRAKWASLGWERGALGYPTNDDFLDGLGADVNTFAKVDSGDNIVDHGAIYDSLNGTWSIHGRIYDHYLALGGAAGVLGYPVTDEQGTPDGIGRFNHFTSRGSTTDAGSIYWTPGGGAWSIHGDIRKKWASMGWESGVLGYPVTDESGTADGVGRFNHFSSPGNGGPANGSIYWTPNGGAWSIHGVIRDKWQQLGWETGALGYPVTDETPTPDGVGRFNHFSSPGNGAPANGSIYWTPNGGAWSIRGAIRDKWASLGWEGGVLGYPITDETPTPDSIGRFNHFSSPGNGTPANGSIYWTPNGGAWSIRGVIRDKWASLGWEGGVLGYPVTDETGTPDGVGRFNHFSKPGNGGAANGSIYWTPNGGAWSIRGAIRDKWAGLGWEGGVLGYPVTDETPTPDGVGRFNHFSSPGNGAPANGSIYWTPKGGAWSIRGVIRDKWASLGWEGGVLGYPVNDETGTPDGVGRFNHFSKPGNGAPASGSIYWTPNGGAWSIHGVIREKWASLGWEAGILGYPVSDETATADGVGRFSHFSSPGNGTAANGSIYWTSNGGAWSIRGLIRDKWASLGWEAGVLGYPVTDENGTPDGVGRFNHFSKPGNGAPANGSVYWTPTTDAHAVYGCSRPIWAHDGWELGPHGYPVGDTSSSNGSESTLFQNHGSITCSSTNAPFVSMGDSYTAGQGGGDYDPQTDQSSNKCRRSANSYPAQAAQQLSMSVADVACSGATIADFYHAYGINHSDWTNQDPWEEAQLFADNALGPGTKLVTATIGGNDVGFASVLKQCILASLSRTACQDFYSQDDGNNLDNRIDALQGPLVQLYADIKSRAPHAQIVAVTYPNIFDPGSDKNACANIGFISDSDVEWLISETFRLDNAITSAAQKAGISVLDERWVFVGHELCTQSPVVNGLLDNLDQLDVSPSFHPMATGYTMVSRDLTALVNNPPQVQQAGFVWNHPTPGIPTVAQALAMIEEPRGAPRDPAALINNWDVKQDRGFTRYGGDALFGIWSTRGGCPTNEAARLRDGDSVTTDPANRCRVTSGIWQSPYDMLPNQNVVAADRAHVAGDPGDPNSSPPIPPTTPVIAVDHVVSLHDAWDMGADHWSRQERTSFGNAWDDPELLTVSYSINRVKSDSTIDQWRPPNADFVCTFALMYTAIKYRFHIAVTEAEWFMLQIIVSNCAPGSTSPPPSTSPTPTPQPAPPSSVGTSSPRRTQRSASMGR